MILKLASLATCGPIITPQGIAQSRGIEALFGREAEFGITPTPRTAQSHEPHDLFTLYGAHNYGANGGRSLFDHSFGHHHQHSSHSGLYATYNSHSGLDAYTSPDSYDNSGLRNIYDYLEPAASEAVPKVELQNGDQNHSEPSKRSKSLISGIISSIHKDLFPQDSLKKEDKKLLKPNPEEYNPNVSEGLLKGIIGGIKKDIYRNDKKPSVVLSDPQNESKPSRSEALLTGIVGGIRRDMFKPNLSFSN